MKKPLVGILMGSESDLPVMEKAAEVLKEMEFPLKWKSAQLIDCLKRQLIMLKEQEAWY